MCAALFYQILPYKLALQGNLPLLPTTVILVDGSGSPAYCLFGLGTLGCLEILSGVLRGTMQC